MTWLCSISAFAHVGRLIAAVGVALAAASTIAQAADMPEEHVLRGSYDIGPPAHVRWDGVVLGGQVGYSNLTANFEDNTTLLGTRLSESTTNSTQFGGFIGYNIQWDNLVVSFDGAYNRFSSMETSSTSGTLSSSIKLIDYGTFRGRAGYAFGQFLPYGFLGGALGRLNHSTSVAGVVTSSRDNAYTAGLVAGLGIDVSIMPNVFVRAEYEYVLFAPVGSIRSSLNTGRAGIGVRF